MLIFDMNVSNPAVRGVPPAGRRKIEKGETAVPFVRGGFLRPWGGLGKADGKGVRRGAAGGVQQAEILVAVL